jgi:predicted NAD-dependent protein-ADP-ribosyltransferase YbiA (DUF1768 family)
MRNDWDLIKVSIMRECIAAKFSDKNPVLVLRLLGTDDAELVEVNSWHDSFFGVCSCGHCPQGDNWLGTILMERRAYLIDMEGQ